MPRAVYTYITKNFKLEGARVTNIKLLGQFKISTVMGDAVPHIGAAKKRTHLLLYLLLRPGRRVPVRELFHALWPYDDETPDQRGALKTTVSRLRTALNDVAPELSAAIRTETGCYLIAPGGECTIDLVLFESLCGEIEGEPEEETALALCRKAFAVYAGPLLPAYDEEPWVVERAAEVHARYIALVARYAALLESLGRWAEIEDIAAHALAIDRFCNEFILLYLRALDAQGKRGEALAYYYDSTYARYIELGEQPPRSVVDFYEHLRAVDRAALGDLSRIHVELTERREPGAFACDYPTFRNIYNLQRLSAGRLGVSIFLSLVTLSSFSDVPLDPQYLAAAMETLERALKLSLRCSDVITRYGSFRYAALLTSASVEAVHVALERAKALFYELITSDDVVFSYSADPILA